MESNLKKEKQIRLASIMFSLFIHDAFFTTVTTILFHSFLMWGILMRKLEFKNYFINFFISVFFIYSDVCCCFFVLLTDLVFNSVAFPLFYFASSLLISFFIIVLILFMLGIMKYLSLNLKRKDLIIIVMFNILIKFCSIMWLVF